MFTILTIDDEENIRTGLADNFELEGYNVKQASNGKEGLALIAKGDIDLVITDLRMDGISGEEVVRHVTTENPGIPIIVLTGHGSIEDATSAIKAGAYDFLTKPLDLDHLNLIVKNALKGRELENQNKELKERLLKSSENSGDMIGKSSELSKVKTIISKVDEEQVLKTILNLENTIYNMDNSKLMYCNNSTKCKNCDYIKECKY